MMTQKRGRACIACASIKIKCQLGSDTNLQPPCERCLRLNKECILSVPKRQKDHVAELEAQIATLTQLLQEQGIPNPVLLGTHLENGDQETSSHNSSVISSNARKRRLLDHSTDAVPIQYVSGPSLSLQDAATMDLARLDKIVSHEDQERILNQYLTVIVPLFPMVPILGDPSLEALRKDRPVLLQSVIYAASPGILPVEVQEDVAMILLERLSSTTIDRRDKSLGFIQAIQITCLWSRPPKHHKHIAVHQLISLASQIADEMGICDMLATSSFINAPKDSGLEATDALRTWLACYHLSSVMDCLMRATASPSVYQEELRHPLMCPEMMNNRGDPHSAHWTNRHDQCLLYIGYSSVALPTDHWLVQYSRAERLCGDIVEHMSLSDQTSFLEVSQHGTKIKIQTCKNQILNWKVKIPQTLRTPTLLLWEHVATAYMYEVVLHTPTNKRSFAAPYVAENLSCSDFPSPMITQDHITAVYEMVAALHAILDIITSFDAATMIALPSIMYASRAAYANYMLAKLYIAVTAPGNTLGSILEPFTLRAEEYAKKLVDLGSKVKTVDERCAPAQMLVGTIRVLDWYASYNSNILSGNEVLTEVNDFGLSVGALDAEIQNQPTDNWSSQLLDSAADFGLDMLFAEPTFFEDITISHE